MIKRAVKGNGLWWLCLSILLLPRKKHTPHDNAKDVTCVFQVKENAPELLWQALSRMPLDVFGNGEYQPAGRKFAPSRETMQVRHDWDAKDWRAPRTWGHGWRV